jgi:acyl-CoA dehydrogenase
MQRRRIRGVLASPDFNRRALMEDEYVEFTKQMETIDTIQHQEAPKQPLQTA